MKIRVVDPASLTADEIALWNKFRAAQQSLSSPYFSTKYFQAASKAIRNVQIAICEVNGEIAVFFPFQRRSLGIGKPVGGPFSDYHGVIARHGFRFDPRTLLQDCGLTAFDFDHLPADQFAFAVFSQSAAVSHCMDLSESFEHYRLQRKAAGSGEIENTLKKQAKLTKEVGSVKFIQHDSDRETFKKLIEWKNDQHKRTGVYPVLERKCAVDLLQEILTYQENDFCGLMPSLYVNGNLAATSFCIRSGETLHYLITTYNVALQKYSPGLILLINMAMQAEHSGLKTIDLGKGEERYKLSLSNHTIPLLEGSVCTSELISLARSTVRAAVGIIESLPIGKAAALPRRAISYFQN